MNPVGARIPGPMPDYKERLFARFLQPSAAASKESLRVCCEGSAGKKNRETSAASAGSGPVAKRVADPVQHPLSHKGEASQIQRRSRDPSAIKKNAQYWTLFCSINTVIQIGIEQ
jgi:hypothetical protein